MKFKNKLKFSPFLLLVSISVSANNNSYQNTPETIKNIPLSKHIKKSKLLLDFDGNEVGRFNLPQNKINRTLRNNKRLYLYNSGIVKNYSFETTDCLGYPIYNKMSNLK
jgi:hypothetical protein